MDLYNFIHAETDFAIKNNVEYTGMTDSTRHNTLSFLDNPKFANDLCKNKNIISAFVRKNDVTLLPENIEAIIVENPKAIFFELHNAYCKKYLKYEASKISESAVIHPTAYVALEGVIIGDNVVVGPNCSVLPGVQISSDTTIGPNCVIGSEGFHVFTDSKGIKKMVIHDGWVIIGVNVDIHASVAIDKGFMGRDTILGDACKIDNLVHIAHRVFIGHGSLITAQSCIAGSCNIGDNAWIGVGSTIKNRITIGKNARVLMGAVVISNIEEGASVSGNFALPHEKHLLADATAIQIKLGPRNRFFKTV